MTAVPPQFLSKWLKAAQDGDGGAFASLVEATRDGLFWTVRRMVGREALAEEILQDAYLALWSLPRGKAPDRVDAWLRRCATNRALDHLRREESKRPHLEVEELSLSVPEETGPLVALGTKEAEERLESALATLPPKMRAAIVLRTEGYGYDEIASLLQVTESTVRNHVLQARNRLAAMLRTP